MAKIWQGAKSERRHDALAALALSARRDLELLNFPAANWVPPRDGPEGAPMLDVLIVGGGMCGQTAGLRADARRHPQPPHRRSRRRAARKARGARMRAWRSCARRST